VRHDVTLGFPVCYGSPSDVFAASSSSVNLVHIQYALKGRRNQRRWWQTQMYANREVDSGSSLLADLNLRSARGLYKNFPVNLKFTSFYWGKKFRTRTRGSGKHFCSRKVGTDTWQFARQPTVPVQNFEASNQLHLAGRVRRSC
jgi:hypothetical protein